MAPAVRPKKTKRTALIEAAVIGIPLADIKSLQGFCFNIQHPRLDEYGPFKNLVLDLNDEKIVLVDSPYQKTTSLYVRADLPKAKHQELATAVLDALNIQTTYEETWYVRGSGEIDFSDFPCFKIEDIRARNKPGAHRPAGLRTQHGSPAP